MPIDISTEATATVVITNPTHFAVALQWERGMPIVENPPLARTLHATVEIDEEIPAEHDKAVAEVISYVVRLNGSARR